MTVAVVLIGGAIILALQGSDKKNNSPLTRGTIVTIPPATRETPPTGRTPSPKADISTVTPSSAAVVINPSPGETGPLDIAEAKEVTTRLWNAHVRARLHGDAALLKAVEAGPALEADYGYLCYIGCRGNDAAMSVQYVNVPRQTSWPVTFGANVQYHDGCTAGAQSCVDTLVMRQEARDRPWKIVFWTTAAGAPNSPEQFPAPSDDGEYAVTAGAPGISANDLLTDYASYLDSMKRTGNPPTVTRLAPGGFTTGLRSYLYDPVEKQRSEGSLVTVQYSVSPADPTWVYASSQNTTLVCGTVRYVASYTGIDGGVMIQPADFSGFGTDVLPGRYSSIVQHGLHMVCFGLHPDASAQAFVLGSYGDDTQVDTKKAP